MKRKFTLIELIAVIAVLSILFLMVIPNISPIKEKSKNVAILSEIRNLQFAVDNFSLENNEKLPTYEMPKIGEPKPLLLSQIYPDYISGLPQNKEVKYWVDYLGIVWGSELDSPIQLKLMDNFLSWNSIEGATHYNIYQSIEKNEKTSSISNVKQKLIFVGSTSETKYEINNSNVYAVSSVNKFGLESPPVTIGYNGYSLNSNTNEQQVEVKKPIANISYTSSKYVFEDSLIQWNSDSSFDPNGYSLIKSEWKIDGIIQSAMPSKLAAGQHTIEMRIKNEKEIWSEWTSLILNVYPVHTVGQQITSPDPGWQRYEQNNAKITYSDGTWITETLSSNSGGKAIYSSNLNSKVTFYFTGTDLRVIGGTYNGRTTNTKVYIDGVLVGTINETNTSGVAQTLVFQKLKLSEKNHKVEIVNGDGKLFLIDAIEINENGILGN